MREKYIEAFHFCGSVSVVGSQACMCPSGSSRAVLYWLFDETAHSSRHCTTYWPCTQSQTIQEWGQPGLLEYTGLS